MSTTSIIGQPAQLEPVQARKARNSTKPPVLQAAVIAKYAEGRNKSQIAQDLGMHRNTVASILNDGEIQQYVQESRSRCVSLAPAAVDAIEYRIKEKMDGNIALGLLRGVQVLSNQSNPANVTNNFAVMIAQLNQAKSNESLSTNESTDLVVRASEPAK